MDYEEVDPGDKRELQLEILRPPGITNKTNVDIIKAFITIDQTCFSALEMEDIDINHGNESIAARAGNVDLQSLLDHLSSTNQNVPAPGSSAGVWETLEISVHMHDLLGNEPSETPLPEVEVGGEEFIDAEEVTVQMIIDHLSTVIASGKRDLEFLPFSNPTIFQTLKEAAQNLLNLWISQFLLGSRETPYLPRQRHVRWRCASITVSISRKIILTAYIEVWKSFYRKYSN